MPAGELHLQLAVNFPDNRKVRKLNRFGREVRPLRDLYVQMCLHSKGNRTDGFVGDEQIGLLVYPDTEKNGMRDAARLAEVDLLERRDDGWFIVGWFDRNPSREAIEQKSAAKARGARLANHRRWHVEMDSPDWQCEWCQTHKWHRPTDQNTDQNTDQSRDESSDQSTESDRLSTERRSDSKETESETESQEEAAKPLGRRAPAGIEVGSDADPDFAAFWDVYPRRIAKGQARRAWKTAVVKGGVDPKAIILGAERYRDDRQRQSRPIDYTKHPGTWLNGECWIEQQPGANPNGSNGTGHGYSNSPWDN